MLLKKTKNFLLFLAILACSLLGTIPCYADFDFDELLDDESTELFIANNTWRSDSKCDPRTIAPALVQFGLIPILSENLYSHTNELTQRSLLDFPIWLPRRWKPYSATFGFDIFWNKTNRMFFTESSSNISSYLNIGPGPLLEATTETFDKLIEIGIIPGNFLFQPGRILPLLQNFTVEQRRIGAMFHAEKRFQKLFLYCFVPIYYIERNMFASEVEQEALTLVFGRLDQASEDAFAKDHLISDKFGLGDTRLSVDFQLKDNENFGLNFGVFTTLPTAFAFVEGINGSSFEKVTRPPCIDILKTACTFMEGTPEEKIAAAENVQVIGYQALNNLSANILESPLGNGGHFGLGFAIQTDSHLKTFIQRTWAEAIDFRSRLSLEYLFPKNHTRTFLQSKESRYQEFLALGLEKTSDVIVAKAETDEAYASDLICFFNEQIMQELFPPVFQARVHPGFIFRSTSKAFHDGENWFFALGNDFWVQSKERLTNLAFDGNCKNNLTVNMANFDIQSARKPVAYQGKVWGSVAYKILRDDVDWILSLNFDQTYYNSGIGQDYTVALGFEAHF